MKQLLSVFVALVLLTPSAKAQKNLQKGAIPWGEKRTFTTIMELEGYLICNFW